MSWRRRTGTRSRRMRSRKRGYSWRRRRVMNMTVEDKGVDLKEKKEN